MTAHAGFTDAAEALAFIQSGKAFVTLSSAKTGRHYTYRIATGKADKTPFFVGVLNGSDNWANYGYMGFIPQDVPILVAGRKGNSDAPSFKALSWALGHLVNGRIPADLTIQHEGKCGRCGRLLTDPVSVARGLGPVCRKTS